MNSAAQTAAAEAPEQAISLEEFWRASGNGNNESFYSPGNQFLGWLTGWTNKTKQEYETYLNNLNIRNEQKAVQSARAYEEFMDNTIYSRAFEDLKRSGINPYLLLNNGSIPATSGASSIKGGYDSRTSTKDTKSNTKGRDAALLILAIARLAAAL